MLNVWTYWAGPMPAWIKTCLDSMRRCCKDSELHVLTPDLLPPNLDLPRRWLGLMPGVGTDCLRSALLAQYGGLWMDADTVCVEDPAVLFRDRHHPEQFLYSRWPGPPDRVIAGYVYSPKGHPIARQWHDRVKSALNNGHQVSWGSLGEGCLTPIVNGCLDRTWEMPLETFLPVNIDHGGVARYFQRSGWRDFIAEGVTVAFGLNYSWMTDKKSAVMHADYSDSHIMIHRLLRDAQQENASHGQA